MGEIITDVTQLHNGDGISYFNSRKEYEGAIVNRIERGRIISNHPISVPQGGSIHRTLDVQWEKALNKNTARRTMWLDVHITPKSLSARSESGIEVTVALNADCQTAIRPQDIRGSFDRFGNTVFRLRNFSTTFGTDTFIPVSQLADARRRMLDAINSTAAATYRYESRRNEQTDFPFPVKNLDFHHNVANKLARGFYQDHGCDIIEDAIEVQPRTVERKRSTNQSGQELSVMTTRHCILREMGCCLKDTPARNHRFRLPLFIHSGDKHFRLSFDCRRCEMHVLK